MALVVEDGTGRADAESYCSVSTADTYHANRGNTAWTALATAAKEQALRKASDYMGAFRGRWGGYRNTPTQGLDWPRSLVPVKDAASGFAYTFGAGYIQQFYDTNNVPVPVQNACAELALKAATGTTLAPDLDPPITREKVGPLETDYLQGGRQTTKFYGVEVVLQPYLSGDSGSMKVSRA